MARPASVLSDNGKQFTSNVEPLDHNKPVYFEDQLMRNHIKHSHRVRHLQTNGKLEKFWDIFENKIAYFKSIDEFMDCGYPFIIRMDFKLPFCALTLVVTCTPDLLRMCGS